MDEKRPPFSGAIWDENAGWLSRIVRCQRVVKYTKNPFELEASGKPLSDESVRFIQDKFYPMPDNARNPLTWIQRCDLLQGDFVKECGAPEKEGDFWAALLTWVPGLVAFPKITTECNVKEIIDAVTGERKKEKFLWELETYYIRRLGYAGNPPNPWEKD